MDLNIKTSPPKIPIFKKYEDLLQKIKQDSANLLHIAKAEFADQAIVDWVLLNSIADTLDYVIMSADSILVNSCSIRENRDALTKLLRKKI
jgi:hypothetical protein